MSNFKGLYDIRDAVPSDRNFILATFLKGLYYGDSWFSTIDKDTFMAQYGKVINALLDLPTTTVKVACLPDDTSVILGYSILGSDYATIHWVYVKSAWRRQGVAKSLLPQYPTTVTHLTALGKTLSSKFPDAIFNPFLTQL